MRSRYDSQKTKVLNHLNNDNGITPIEALKLFGAFRLSAIIFDLRKDGYDIQTNLIQNGGKRYAYYKLRG
jgi:hypothetical protein